MIFGARPVASLDAAKSGPAYQIDSLEVIGFKPMLVLPVSLYKARTGGADPCFFCSLGAGICVQGNGTHVPYTLATLHFDDTCPNCHQLPDCCNGGVVCGSRYVCNATCDCQFASPIIVDTTGKGFHLTSADDGVMFDILGDGRRVQIAWTAADSGNAFLALDRNHDGKIDRGEELFGNVTAQPKSGDPNGFLALAEFDKKENGGNGDGIIDEHDAVFSHLLLWIDENHDGISQPSELHTLPELGVFSLALRYRDDKHFFDRYGNWFHYQAVVNPNQRGQKSNDGRIAYDVFLEVGDYERARTGSPMQSRVPDRSDHAGLSLERLGGYQDGVLYDDVLLASLRARKTKCRPRPAETTQEAQK